MRIASFALGFVAYVVSANAIFGDVVQAPRLLLQWPDRLGIPGWRLLVLAEIAALAWAFHGPLKRYVRSPIRFPAFVLAATLIPTIGLVLIADWQRKNAIADFSPDLVVQNSLFTSLSQSPEALQFYLHAAALKGCTPYAWSYRSMAFYALDEDISVNVLPQSWIDMCGITRSGR